MADHLSNWDLMNTTDNDLHKKMSQSLIAQARYIAGVEDPATPNHENRIKWAQWLLAAPERSNSEGHRGMSWFLSDPDLADQGNLASDALCDSVAAANIDNLAAGGYV